MAMLVLARWMEERLKAEREESGSDRFDEVWDGVYVVSPNPNNEHQSLATDLATIFVTIIGWSGMGRVQNIPNVSDREAGWVHNYRSPDVAVFLKRGLARNLGTHWVGGPDFAVEIISSDDRSREKLPFYAQIGVRELLIIDRDPWALELYRLQDDQLVEVARAEPGQADAIASAVLPFAFRLVPDDDRPRIEITHVDGVQRWLI